MISANLSNFIFYLNTKNIGLLVLMEIIRFLVEANRLSVRILTVGYSKEFV
jgi:hypothetical protein